MRIISGLRRGFRLQSPEGMQTRPTTDRVKESLFNIIQFHLPCTQVLDLFAGSGALGLECLSRRCTSCTFVDNRSDSIRIIRENLQNAKLADAADVRQTDALSYLSAAEHGFDLIFMDPPYNVGLIDPVLNMISRRGLLNPKGLIVVESEKNGESVPNTYYEVRRTAAYGKTVLTVLQG